MPDFDLVIFDCDGTLVDSEHLYNAVTAELLNELGYEEYSAELCMEIFGGMSWSEMVPKLEAKHGQKIPADIIARFIKISGERIPDMLKPVEGVHDILDIVRHRTKICIASNGERNNLLQSLRITGLDKYFPENVVFSKIHVEKAKPAPDMFLYAAEKMESKPSSALVLEDSTHGVVAGKAAGMEVWGFVGTAHAPGKQSEALKKAGADRIIDKLIHIPDLLEL